MSEGRFNFQNLNFKMLNAILMSAKIDIFYPIEANLDVIKALVCLFPEFIQFSFLFGKTMLNHDGKFLDLCFDRIFFWRFFRRHKLLFYTSLK